MKHTRAPTGKSTLSSATRRCNVTGGRFYGYKYYQWRTFGQTSASYNTADVKQLPCFTLMTRTRTFSVTDFNQLNFSMHIIHNNHRIRETDILYHKTELGVMATGIY